MASVDNTEPELLRTWTVRVSNTVVVVVSAVSICSQNVSVAAVALAGIVTCCRIDSVVVEPWPSSQASKVPECGGSVLLLLMILLLEAVVLAVHGEGLDAPFSNPGLPSNWVVPPPPGAVTVSATVAV